MENIPVLGQTSQLLASGIILLALCLGVIFYFWSLNLFKKIESLMTSMRKNIDSLENLSQSIYETAYLEMKEKTGYLNQKTAESSQSLKTTLKSTEFSQSEEEEEQDKYQEISSLIINNLKGLLEEKEQVTAQDLVYIMPNQYPIADIYRTLEEMKERNQINWEDKHVSPQSVLKLRKK